MTSTHVKRSIVGVWFGLLMITASCSENVDPLADSEGVNPLASQAQSTPTVTVDIVDRATYSVVATSLVERLPAWSRPDEPGAPLAAFDHPRPTGAPLVFLVIGREPGWLEVMLPVRPNGSTGWIREEQVELSQNPYRIEIDVADHRLTLWKGTELHTETTVAIGTGPTPTPIGTFYLTELVQPPNPDGLYGTYAYGLSGFSETLQSFNGGDGVIGLHGTNDPSSLGTDVSKGCVRLANDVIDELATFLPLGTPVVIT